MNFADAFQAKVFRLRQPQWNEYAHVEIVCAVLPVLGDGVHRLHGADPLAVAPGPWVRLRDVPSEPDGPGEREVFYAQLDDPDYEPWVPPADAAERAEAFGWKTYEDGPLGWWFAMWGRNPGDPVRTHPSVLESSESFLKAVSAWHAHPDPKARCACGDVFRHWGSPRAPVGEIACAQPRCDRYAKAHDGFDLVEQGEHGDLLGKIRDGVRRSTKEDNGEH